MPEYKKPAVLLLSGLLCSDHVWDDVLPFLGDVADFKPVSFQGYDSLTSMADHALACVTGPVALVGHSMGGRVALEAFRKAPERIIGLGLMNTGVHPTAEGEYESRGRLVKLGYDQGMAVVADQWLPPMMRDDASPELLDRLKAMVATNTPESFEGQQKALLDRADATQLLREIRVPTFLLSGSEDKWSPLDQHTAMAKCIPDSVVVEVPNAGHMALNENPEAVAKAILDWVVRLAE